jgi:CheY-like chemotaxis protein
MMPDLNGNEVLKVIKSDPDKRDIPVVMISADTNADKVSQCSRRGRLSAEAVQSNDPARADRRSAAQTVATHAGK